LIHSTAAGVEIDVRVIPRAKKTAIGGARDGALVVRIAAPPVDGAANDALLEFFSSTLHLARRAIRIVAGERGRQKRIAIDGVTVDAVRALLKGDV
jgi:uncharacterized protein (TIGR00251 family)